MSFKSKFSIKDDNHQLILQEKIVSCSCNIRNDYVYHVYIMADIKWIFVDIPEYILYIFR